MKREELYRTKYRSEHEFKAAVAAPNRESVIRLLGALLMELDEKWASGRRYLDMDDYYEWRQSHPIKQLNKVTHIR